MKIPDLVFLPVEHNVARAYMAAMRDAGVQPARTILVYCEDVPLPSRRGSRLSWVQRTYDFLYGSREEMRRQGPKALLRLTANMAVQCYRARLEAHRGRWLADLTRRLVRHAHEIGLPVENPDIPVRDLLQRYGWPFEERRVRSLNDDDFVRFVSSECRGSFMLYVGGGILRKPLLESGAHFIHIHPGVVPDVRGSHCLFWSVLVRGRPGVSCFFMNEGIDTGDVVATHEYELKPAHVPRRYLAKRMMDLSAKAVLDALDPWYRGDMLRRLLREEPQPSRWSSRKQPPGSGKVYYFPHPLLRDKAVRRLLQVS